MKKVSLTSKILSLISSVIVVILICSKWLCFNVSFGMQNRFSLFEISTFFGQTRIFNSLELAVLSIVLSTVALAMIVLTVISAVYAISSTKTSYIVNTVSAAINTVFSIAFIIGIIAMNFEFMSELSNGMVFRFSTSGIVSATKSPYLVILFSVISRIVLIPRTPNVKALPAPSANNADSIKICPACGAKCGINSKFCQNCGKSFENDTIVCPNCKRHIANTAVFCNYCGVRIAENDINTENTENEDIKNTDSNENTEVTENTDSSENTEVTENTEITQENNISNE